MPDSHLDRSKARLQETGTEAGANWSRLWTERLSRSRHQTGLRRRGISSEQFWDGFSRWQELHRYTRYPGRVLERILEAVDAQTTVLDIGAGNGAFAIPVAKAAKQVTAVEPSPGQIARLMENAALAGVGNINVLQSRWEDVSGAEAAQHDLVVAAYCFQMNDITSALEKMYRAAGRSLFLVHSAGHDMLGPLGDILGNMETGPDYVHLYNVLSEMGHRASVEVFTRDYEIPLDFDLEILGYSQALSAENKGKLRRHLEMAGKVFARDGVPWVRRQYKDALIHLNKEVGLR